MQGLAILGVAHACICRPKRGKQLDVGPHFSHSSSSSFAFSFWNIDATHTGPRPSNGWLKVGNAAQQLRTTWELALHRQGEVSSVFW